jgi:hypothetical protein
LRTPSGAARQREADEEWRTGAGRTPDGQEDHWLPDFNFNVEEWFEGDRYEALAICRSLALARAAFAAVGRGEARRPLHDPQPNADRAASPTGRLVSVLIP